MTCPECGGEMLTFGDDVAYKEGKYRVHLRSVTVTRCDDCSYEIMPEQQIENLKAYVTGKLSDFEITSRLDNVGFAYFTDARYVGESEVWIYNDDIR